MRSSLQRVARISAGLSTLALWAAGIGLVLMTGFIAWQVWGRYVLNASPSWTEPASVMLMAWFIFLGAAIGIRESYHLGFDILLYVLPPSWKIVLRTLADLVVMGFGVAMVKYGLELTMGTWDSTLPALGLPGGFDYLPLVAGGVLAVLFSLEKILRRLAGLPVGLEDRD